MCAKTAIRAIAQRELPAPPEKVYDAWLKPSWLERWMFGPAVRAEEIVHLALDPRVGGAFSFMVDRGGEKIEHVGRYLDLKRPRHLAFSWTVAEDAVGSRVLVDIAPAASGSVVTVTHELHPAWADHVEGVVAAWQHMLDALALALGRR